MSFRILFLYMRKLVLLEGHVKLMGFFMKAIIPKIQTALDTGFNRFGCIRAMYPFKIM